MRYIVLDCQSVTDILSWTHICVLMQAEDELERSFYEKECIAQKWDVRTLKRQMKSALYLRLAVSKDKEGIISISDTKKDDVENVSIEEDEDKDE